MKSSSYLTRRKGIRINKLLLFIFRKIFREEIDIMAIIYATLIVKGKKNISDVPEKIREQVKAVLIDLDVPELAE